MTAPPLPRLFGVALISGTALMLVSTLLYVATGEGVNHGVVGGTVGIWSCFAMVLGYLGLARSFESPAPRASLVLTVLAVVGLMTGYGYNLEGIHLAHLGADIWSEPFDDAIGYLAFDPWGLFLPLALLLTGFLVWRTRLYARWTAAPLVLGGLLFVPSREAGVDALAVVADLLLLAGLVPLGVSLIQPATPERSP